MSYELYMQAASSEAASLPDVKLVPTSGDATGGSGSDGATGAELDGMYAHLEQVLFEIGFVRPETVAHQMRAFRQLLARARPESADVALLRGLWRQVLWAARRQQP